MLRWGILGAGSIARTVGHDIAASTGSAVTAVGARDLGRASALAGELGAPRSYGSYDDLVADPEIDVIYIATVHSHHHEHALLALAAGKHVLVEKAFTLNATQAREVVGEAQRHHRFCMEAMWLRFNPLIRRAVAEVGAGRIGELIGVRADLSAHFPFDPSHRLFDLDQGGGALLDLGVYPLHFAWTFLGSPSTVQVVGTLSPTGSDATAALQLGYPGGAFAQLACSAVQHNPSAALITGSLGWISLEPRLHRPRSITIRDGDGEQVIMHEDVGFAPEIAEVERCIAAGWLESGIMPWQDTVQAMTVLDEARAVLGVRYPRE